MVFMFRIVESLQKDINDHYSHKVVVAADDAHGLYCILFHKASKARLQYIDILWKDQRNLTLLTLNCKLLQGKYESLPMSNYNSSSPMHQPIQRFLDDLFGLGIQGACGFVK